MKNNYVKYQIIFAAILIVFLISCEQTVENPDLPYKEQLVIRCVLEAGKKVEDVEITKTLPPLDAFTYEKALIKDAEVVIKSGEISYPLTYSNSTERYYSNDLIPEIGKQYTLQVKSKNLMATASTIIPEPVEIDSFYYRYVEENYNYGEKYWYYLVYAVYKPKPGAVYLGGYTNWNDNYIYYSYDIKRNQDTLSNGKISQSFLNISPYDSTPIEELLKDFIAHIVSLDSPYYYYNQTRWEGSGGDDIFGTSGVNVRGNIKGGLGLFIGISSVSKDIDLK